jgi:transcription termination factor Rho
MNLTELKQNPIAQLTQTAQDMGVENVSRTRKQDIIFAILKKHAKTERIFQAMESLKYFKMDLAFFVLQTLLI